MLEGLAPDPRQKRPVTRAFWKTHEAPVRCAAMLRTRAAVVATVRGPRFRKVSFFCVVLRGLVTHSNIQFSSVRLDAIRLMTKAKRSRIFQRSLVPPGSFSNYYAWCLPQRVDTPLGGPAAEYAEPFFVRAAGPQFGSGPAARTRTARTPAVRAAFSAVLRRLDRQSALRPARSGSAFC